MAETNEEFIIYNGEQPETQQLFDQDIKHLASYRDSKIKGEDKQSQKFNEKGTETIGEETSFDKIFKKVWI
jgi:hypothetical protein